MTDSKLILKKFIREVVNRTITELAKEPQDAENSGFALIVIKEATSIILVMFQPRKLQDICDDMAKEPEHLSLDARLDSALYMNPNPVVGFIKMVKSDCGWIIQNSAANKGYGPMMYDIAFVYAGNQGITPDRESVSDDAKNIWKYYSTKRKNEFNLVPFDSVDPCATHYEGSRYLNVRYVMKQPDSNKAKNLLSKGEEALQQVQQRTQGKLSPKDILQKLAGAFFDQSF